MRRFKGFGARSCVEKAATDASPSIQCFPQFYSPVRGASLRRRSVDGRVADVREPTSSTGEEGGVVAIRRRSVDELRLGESVDLQTVRKEWKSNSCAAMSSSDSFSSSRPSTDASAISSDMSRELVPQQHASGGQFHRVVVVGFDTSAKEGGVGETVTWAVRSAAMQRGDVLVLFGVVGTVRGPLGFKVQVNDQTWLGASKKFLEKEVTAKNLAWARGLPGLRKRCADAGVKVLVDVKPASRAEVAIVAEATALGAVHVVLDKSLLNKRRRYYLERLACHVTRMRRSGGVDTIRLRDPPGERNAPLSPNSVLPQRASLAPGARTSFNASLFHLMKLVDEKNLHRDPVVHSTRRQSLSWTIDEEELFCIDHDFLTRRVEMLLAPEPDLGSHRRRDQLIFDDGYESDDLFSLAGDGASRRPSLAFFGMDSGRSSLRSSLSRVNTQLASPG